MEVFKLIILFSIITFLVFFYYNRKLIESYGGISLIEDRPGVTTSSRWWYNNSWDYLYVKPNLLDTKYTIPLWGNSPFWGPFESKFCPVGCSKVKNGKWNCTHPGSGPDNCWYQEDCDICS